MHLRLGCLHESVELAPYVSTLAHLQFIGRSAQSPESRAHQTGGSEQP